MGDPLAGADTLGRPAGARRRFGAGAAAALVLTAGLLGGGAGGTAGYLLAERDDETNTVDGTSLGPTARGSADRPAGSVAAVAQELLPRVVSISVRAGSSGGTGSGFVVRSDGYIVTNNHVIRDAAAGGEVRVTFNDRKEAIARIVGRDTSYDLAVLKINARNLPAMEFADSDAVKVGDSVIAIGSPLGLSGTVTTGIISARERPVTADGDGAEQESSYINALQTDAAINPGNSGGPLVDASGKVIGVNSAIAQLPGASRGSIGVGFAIPSKQAKRTAEQLIATGRATHPIMGVRIDPSYDDGGVRLERVTSGGPADRAGLRDGDVITEFEGKRLVSPQELVVNIRAQEPGDVVRVTYRRGGGAPQQASVTLQASE
jgi:putative serine protease PepD